MIALFYYEKYYVILKSDNLNTFVTNYIYFDFADFY